MSRRTLDHLSQLLFLVLVIMGIIYIGAGLLDLLASWGCP